MVVLPVCYDSNIEYAMVIPISKQGSSSSIPNHMVLSHYNKKLVRKLSSFPYKSHNGCSNEEKVFK